MDFSAVNSHTSMFMKLLFDMFPVALFFVAYKFAGIYVATTIAIVANVLQIAWLTFAKKKIEPMVWISLAIIVVFGGATLLLHDETFIKWKPTVLYWAFAAVLAGGQWFFNKNFIRVIMEKNMALPELIWRRLNLMWAAFFAVMGIINLYVAYNFSTDTWVNFKLFGGMGLMILFVIAQGLMLSKYVPEQEQE